jgi:two-component system, OmpR family, phosphate regulon sensor histidine kinase PhoR
MKPHSPNAIAVWLASANAILVAVILTVIKIRWESQFLSVWSICFWIIFSWVFSYFLSRSFIESFLYKRIKIIYKNIHAFKSQSERRPSVPMASDVILDIEQEVSNWVEDKIKELKDLHATDNFRKEFIGNLAHELKTPLFGIQGYIETLLDDDLQDTHQVKMFLEKANRQADRLGSLISDLDQISKLESGALPLNVERFDLIQIVHHAIETLENAARNKSIHVHLKEGSPKNLFVMGDQQRIQQVLTNLISNAIHYGVQGGEIKIRFYDMEEHVLCEVADNGIGIAKEHLPRIFERFYRVDKSRSRNDGGSGLGLAICKHIIEAHHQSISVRSTEDIGSTFGFTLKRA